MKQFKITFFKKSICDQFDVEELLQILNCDGIVEVIEPMTFLITTTDEIEYDELNDVIVHEFNIAQISYELI